MIESKGPLTLILFLNSLLTIGLILNQNESTKDSATTQNSSSLSNPFEIVTWVCLGVQLVLLLLKLKVTDSWI